MSQNILPSVIELGGCSNKYFICAIFICLAIHVPKIQYLPNEIGLNTSVLYSRGSFLDDKFVTNYWFRHPDEYQDL